MSLSVKTNALILVLNQDKDYEYSTEDCYDDLLVLFLVGKWNIIVVIFDGEPRSSR